MNNLLLDDFPKEILEHIVAYMGSNEQLNMRLANTKWFKLVNYRNFILKFVDEKTLPAIIERLLQYNGPIGLKFVKSKIKKLEVYAQVSRLTNLTSLELPYFHEDVRHPRVWESFMTLTNLREWEVPYGCPASVTASLINMRKLTLNDHLDILLETVKKMTNLEWLECSPNNENPVEPVDVFSLLPSPARVTCLATNGNLDYSYVSKLYNLRDLQYIDDDNNILFELPLNKFTALDTLHIQQDHLSFGALPTTLTCLTICGESMDTKCNQYLARLHSLKELNIQTLHLNDEQYSWISHLTLLETMFLWPNTEADLLPFTGAIFNMIMFSRLKELEIKVTEDMDVGHLSCLTRLESLVFNEDQAELHPDYSFISHLTRLTYFSLFADDTDRPSLTALAHLKNLKNLRVSRAQVPMSLDRLTSLESLIIDQCDAHVFESFSALTRLTYLKANSLPDINYEFLTSIPLQGLRISENAHDRFYTVLVQLTGLQALQIHGLSSEQVKGLSALRHLTWLDVTKCDVGEGLHITHLTTLQQLYVNRPFRYSSLIESSLPNLTDWWIMN